MSLLSVSLFLTGCQNPEEELRAPLQGRTVLTAQILPLEVTRPLDTPLQSDETPHSWEKQMHIGAFDRQGSQNVKYTLFSASEGAVQGQFYGPELVGNVYAYYPYEQGVTADGSKLVFPLEEVQDHNPDVLEMFKKYSKYHVACSSEDVLEFRPLYGCLAFRVKGNFSVRSLKLTSQKTPLAGRIAFDFEHDMQASAAAGSVYELTINCPEGVASSEEHPAIVYALLPAATYDDLSVEVFTDKDEKIVRELSSDIVVSRMNLDSVDENIAYETIEITLENVAVAKKSWEESDQLAIYSPERDRSKVVDLYSEAGGLTNSVLAIGNSDEPYNVVYPASAVQQMGNVATVLMPSEQTYCEGAVDEQTHIYAGRCQDGKGELYLVNSILAVNVTAPAQCTVEGLSLSSSATALAGVFEIDMAYTDRPIAVAKDGNRTITMNLYAPININAGETKTFYFAVPAGEYQAEDLTVEVNSSLGVPSAAYSSSLTTARAQITQAPAFEIEVTDLTAGGKYANCFVLPNQKGWYSFAAKIKGGYDKDEDNNDICTPTSVAGTLFELNSGMISHVNLCDNSSRVSFYYDGSIGNASIATIERGDGEPYKGMVLWAWHLWCPGDGQPQDVVFGNNTYMDRNLGALYVPTSKAEMEAMTDEVNLASGGMLYSWGRPSPFPYPKSYTAEAWGSQMGQKNNVTTPKYYYPSASLITRGTYGSATGGVQSSKVWNQFTSFNQVYFTTSAAATKLPLCIGLLSNTSSDIRRYWCDAWKYDVQSEKASWNYSHEKNKQYDPCPYGYELPQTDVIVADLKSFYGANNAQAYLVKKDVCFKGGYYLEKDGKFLWHAVSGLRVAYGLWKDVSSNNANLAGATTNDSPNFLLWWGAAGAGGRIVNSNNEYWNPATATSVRCIKK